MASITVHENGSSNKIVTRTGVLLDFDDRQGIFEYVIARLDEQGYRSVTGVSCVYRSNRGGACAVGWLLSDELVEGLRYVPSYDVTALIQRFENVGEALGVSDEGLKSGRSPRLAFLTALQVLHDQRDNWSFGTISLAAITDFCTKHDLTIPASRSLLLGKTELDKDSTLT